MDILNFISWIASKRRVVKTLNKTDLIPIGVRTETRDDKYTTVAISTVDFAASVIPPSPYKVYTALLTQEGTNAPVATVLEDTIGNISFAYDGVGLYRIVNSQSFDQTKTAMFFGPEMYGYFKKAMYGPSYWGIVTYNDLDIQINGAPGQLILNNTPIEIRIY